MKVALVAPPWEVMVNSYPPLGLGYVAAATRDAGFPTSIYDYGLEPHATIARMVDEVSAEAPDVIGITTWTHLYHVCCDLAKAFKQRLPDVTIVLGGPHVTIFPAETLEEEPSADFVVYGEGELTMVELLRAMDTRGPYDGILGLAWRSATGVVKNPTRPINKDIETLPFPARDLMRLERYPLRAWDGEPMTTMMTSRGCPYACTYCFKGLFGRRYITTPNDAIIAEMEEIHAQYGITHFYFVDDLFVVNLTRLMEFVDEMRKRKLPFRWQCLARVDRLQREHYFAMAEAGCSKIHYGIETGDPEVMVRVDKEATIEEVRNAVTWCHEAGIQAKGYFMIGLPGETEVTTRRTIDLACELPLADAMFSLTTPFPGTALWNDVKDRFVGIPRKELFRRASYYYGTRNVSEPMFNLSQLPTERLIELVDQAEFEFRTRGFKAREIEKSLGSGLDRMIFRLTQKKWVKRMGVGPLRNLGKRWLKGKIGAPS
jgi:anaerobic magnesium-protoporphyrin IX monomethyl ester cyclase